ncbi:MAG: hypothetical protein EKK48_03535 [Candidatus Melainabacteria bacterium]|nr:MAG: hypothetical protein EKK48_03535 [Candidatus Melainabacteria bacterium]
MNTTEKPPGELDSAPAPSITPSSLEGAAPEQNASEQKISGFDGGTRSLLKQPSLFLCVVLICVAMAACFGKTPNYFWVMTLSLIGLTAAFHLIAEKLLGRANSEFELPSPREGVLTVLFGSVLPGLGLIAYALYSLINSTNFNFFDELGKLTLLLVVPVFNFSVWSSLRRRYLIRPRLTGVMNGFALGLSASWTVIWLKSSFISHAADTKFGWMLLLSLSPVLLFAAVRLSFDLHRKTEPKISRIATTFSFLGCLLSILFVFAPLTRTFYIQSLLSDIFKAPQTEQPALIANLRAQATPEDLRPSKNPVSGFALSSMLFGNRGLDGGSDRERDLFFKVAGKSFNEDATVKNRPGNHDANQPEESADLDTTAVYAAVGSRNIGLSLAKSQMVGNIDSATMTGSLDWSMTFHNSSNEEHEARAVIALPADAVVSRVTLWINGEAREAAFASPARTRAAYESVVKRSRDPLLVTMLAPGKILVQCYPVPINGAMKIRLGFKIALQPGTSNTSTLVFPRLIASNFAQQRRHQIRFLSSSPFADSIAGGVSGREGSAYVLSGTLRERRKENGTKSHLSVLRTAPLTAVATFDATARPPQYIVQHLKETVKTPPKRLIVVVDSSESMRDHLAEIHSDLAKVSTFLKPLVYFVPEATGANAERAAIRAMSVSQAKAVITSDAFKGGQDNKPVLTEALELAAEAPQGAVLWIHGPQPLTQDLTNAVPLDLVHPVRLYDWQIESGANEILQALSLEDPLRLINREVLGAASSIPDIDALVRSWVQPEKKLFLERVAFTRKPDVSLVENPIASMQVSRLWADGEVRRLLADGFERQALILAAQYRIVSPVTGAVVLDDAEEYRKNKLDPGAYKDAPGGAPSLLFNPDTTASRSESYSGLVGAPVDPRYGQSNEVGQMADFGYDTMRDISRWVTAFSFLVALIFVIPAVRTRKSVGELLGAVCTVCGIPLVVHLLGIYLINNFGGLGGGL